MLYDDPGEGGCSEGREAQEGEDMCMKADSSCCMAETNVTL